MYAFKRLVFAITILLIVIISTARAQDNAVVGSGSTLAYSFISKIIADHGRVAHININYQSIGSAAGLAQLNGNTIDFAVSDIPSNKTNPSVLYIPIVRSEVAIAYNVPGVKATLKLSNAVLADIFLKRITKWNAAAIAALNPGVKLPSIAIQIVARAGGSGTAHIFNNYLSKVSPGFKTGSINAKLTSKTNQGNAGWVKLTPGTIAYVGLSYAKQYNLTCAAIQSKAGKFIEPGTSNYPIAGLTCVVIYKEQNYSNRGVERARQLVNLLRYITHNGQKAIQPLGYRPLSATLVNEAQKTLSLITYNGKALQI